MNTLFIPDLNLWFSRHSEMGTLPDEVSGLDLPEICEYLGVPLWKPLRAWKRESGRITIEDTRTATERVVRYRDESDGAEFTAKWSIGPDGDLWQTEYPVKTGEDLRLFEALAQEERIIFDPDVLSRAISSTPPPGNSMPARGGKRVPPPFENMPPAAELPPHPFARLLLEMLGFNEGFFILMEEEERIGDIIAEAQKGYISAASNLVESLDALSGGSFGADNPQQAALYPHLFAWSPDNLDASFITPGWFETYMLEGYRQAADILRQGSLGLMVHAGGPAGSLLGLIRDGGISCTAGVCGPPQGDTPLPAAREKAGPDMILWGGIPQDCLMPPAGENDFLSALAQVKTGADERCIIGIADHVPVEASWERLKKAASFFRSPLDA